MRSGRGKFIGTGNSSLGSIEGSEGVWFIVFFSVLVFFFSSSFFLIGHAGSV